MLSRHQEETQGHSLRLLIAFILFLSSSGLPAGEASHRSSSTSATAPPFVLSTQHERISLDAANASLKAVVEQIGRKLDIRVDAYVSEDEKVAAQFDALPLEQAIKQLSVDWSMAKARRWGS